MREIVHVQAGAYRKLAEEAKTCGIETSPEPSAQLFDSLDPPFCYPSTNTSLSTSLMIFRR